MSRVYYVTATHLGAPVLESTGKAVRTELGKFFDLEHAQAFADTLSGWVAIGVEIREESEEDQHALHRGA